MSDEVDNVQVESEARVFGWVPLEEFRGGEEKWVDADTFVKRGKEINPILKKNNEVLLRKLAEANARVDEIGKAAEEFRVFQKEQNDKRIREYENQLTELKKAKVEAVSSGDGERVVAIDDAIDTIKEERDSAKLVAKEVPKKPETPVVPIDPAVQAWINRNDWYEKDEKKRRIANRIAGQLREENPGLVNQAFLDRLSDDLEESFPKLFGKGKPNSPVESGSNQERPTRKGVHTYENLPEESKKACDRFCKTLKNFTREKYLAEYNWN